MPLRALREHTLRVGADHTHTVGPSRPEQLPLRCNTESFGAGEARRHDDRCTDTRCGGVGHHGENLVGGYHDHHEVDLVSDRVQAAVSRQTCYGFSLRVDCVQPSGEATRADGIEDAVAQADSRAAYADHGHAVGIQQRAQRTGLGTPLAAVRGVHGGGRRLGAQLDRHLATIGTADHGEAGRSEHAEHPVVVREHLGLESGDAVISAQGRQVLQK